MSSWPDYLVLGIACLGASALAWQLVRRLAMLRRESRWDRGLK
jgi:hypothetical protein